MLKTQFLECKRIFKTRFVKKKLKKKLKKKNNSRKNYFVQRPEK